MNGYALLEALERAAEARRLAPPLRVMISCTADEARARNAGADRTGHVGHDDHGGLVGGLEHQFYIFPYIGIFFGFFSTNQLRTMGTM